MPNRIGTILQFYTDQGRLDGVASVLPNPDLFLAMYVRHEAVLSSQIEGTQSTLEDVLEFELEGPASERPTDVEEVVNYVRAMNYGVKRLKELPLYYDRLMAIRNDGDWESWVRFFLRGVFEVSQGATETTRAILDLHEGHRQAIGERLSGSANGQPHQSPLSVRLSPHLAHSKLSNKPANRQPSFSNVMRRATGAIFATMTKHLTICRSKMVVESCPPTRQRRKDIDTKALTVISESRRSDSARVRIQASKTLEVLDQLGAVNE